MSVRAKIRGVQPESSLPRGVNVKFPFAPSNQKLHNMKRCVCGFVVQYFLFTETNGSSLLKARNFHSDKLGLVFLTSIAYSAARESDTNHGAVFYLESLE